MSAATKLAPFLKKERVNLRVTIDPDHPGYEGHPIALSLFFDFLKATQAKEHSEAGELASLRAARAELIGSLEAIKIHLASLAGTVGEFVVRLRELEREINRILEGVE